jgi:hypothetical protein
MKIEVASIPKQDSLFMEEKDVIPTLMQKNRTPPEISKVASNSDQRHSVRKLITIISGIHSGRSIPPKENTAPSSELTS